MHDEVIVRAGTDGVLHRHISDRLLGERALEEKVAVPLDVVHRHAGVAQRAQAREDELHGARAELVVGDEVVKEVAVEVERARPERLEAVEPGHDRLLAAVAEADVRVADDEDLSGCGHSAVFKFARGFTSYAASTASTASPGACFGTYTIAR